MPTGCTAEVADGKVADFRIFALRCARAFGATVMQRGEPLSDPPRHREAADYHEHKLAGLEVDMERLRGMTLEQAEVEMATERARVDKDNEQRRVEKAMTRARYEAMLAAVRTWTPPTSDHAGLKRFMDEQLTESIKHDCGDYQNDFPYQTAAEWLEAKRGRVVRDIKYHADEHAKEVARCAEANAWIDALYASL